MGVRGRCQSLDRNHSSASVLKCPISMHQTFTPHTEKPEQQQQGARLRSKEVHRLRTPGEKSGSMNYGAPNVTDLFSFVLQNA